jgi:Fe-S cluster assembly ATP-binding protein
MLDINNLHVSCGEKAILKGINFSVKPGEVHAIMGPNGSGKSTLSKVVAGHQDYQVNKGELLLDGESLIDLSPEERAHKGVFLSFQYPVEIPGVTNVNFLKASVNAVQKARGQVPMDAIEFLSFVRAKCNEVGMDEDFLYRSLNDGFSGGEKKRNEILQMLLLEPRLAILDETDSGLDIDALKTVAQGINSMRNPDRGIVLVTHYQRLLDYIEPDFIHVLADGKIIRSGDKSLALELETKGYRWLEDVA